MATTKLASPLPSRLSFVPHSQQIIKGSGRTGEIGACASTATEACRSALPRSNNAFYSCDSPTAVRLVKGRASSLQSSSSWSRKADVSYSVSFSGGSPYSSISHDYGIGCRLATSSGSVTARLSSGVDWQSATSSRFVSVCQLRRRMETWQCRARGGAGNDENAEGLSTTSLSGRPGSILPSGWRKVGLTLFGSGVLLGPPLDGIHSRVGLQVYDNGALDILGLRTNIWVFPLLGVFYSVVGLLQLALDRQFAPKANLPTASLTKVAASFITLVVLLGLSAELYAASVPSNIEGYILFFGAELNWLLFDNTWWGFGLAAVSGIGCPALELPIIKFFQLWHYPQANIFLFGQGTVTWLLCNYFYYTPFVANLARWLSTVYEDREASEKLRK